MDLEVLSKSKDSIEFKLKGERHTFPMLLKQKLLQDSKVEFAAYKLEHPLDSDSIFAIKTNSGTPEKALETAVKAIEAELSEFKTKIKKAK